LPERIVAPEEPAESPPDDISQRFIENTRADIRHGGSKACFVPSLDVVQLPPRNAFESVERYFATALHELGHNAEPSVMPHRSGIACSKRSQTGVLMRHNQSDSRKLSKASSGL
jgi:antirestriction protein ArdC